MDRYLPIFFNDKLRSQTPTEKKTNRREFFNKLKKKSHRKQKSQFEELKQQKESSLIIQCGVCLTTYNTTNHQPYVLMCGHSICNNVIDKEYKNQKIRCPFCNEWHKFSKREKFRKNFTLISMMEKIISTQFIGITNSPDPEVYDEMIMELRNENQKLTNFSIKVTNFIDTYKQKNSTLIGKLEKKKSSTNLSLLQNQLMQVEWQQLDQIRLMQEKVSKQMEEDVE